MSMNPSRRTFLQQSALALAGSALFSNHLFAATRALPILGIQLYSVRDDMHKDAADTLKQLAAMGYKNVEHASYSNRQFYGYTPADFKKLLDDLGLSMCSGHTSIGARHWDAVKKDFIDEWKYTIEDAAIAGQRYVISPWLDDSQRKNIDDFKAYMEVFNKSGELCRKSGMKFGYHNHDYEFSTQLNGASLFELMLQHTDPSLVAYQLDIGNMYLAGAKALDFVKRYPGRFELMHVKDEVVPKKKTNEAYESAILGTGLIPVKEIIDLGQRSGGTRYFIVEQESYQGKQPLHCMQEDYRIMKEWGY